MPSSAQIRQKYLQDVAKIQGKRGAAGEIQRLEANYQRALRSAQAQEAARAAEKKRESQKRQAEKSAQRQKAIQNIPKMEAERKRIQANRGATKTQQRASGMDLSRLHRQIEQTKAWAVGTPMGKQYGISDDYKTTEQRQQREAQSRIEKKAAEKERTEKKIEEINRRERAREAAAGISEGTARRPDSYVRPADSRNLDTTKSAAELLAEAPNSTVRTQIAEAYNKDRKEVNKATKKAVNEVLVAQGLEPVKTRAEATELVREAAKIQEQKARNPVTDSIPLQNLNNLLIDSGVERDDSGKIIESTIPTFPTKAADLDPRAQAWLDDWGSRYEWTTQYHHTVQLTENLGLGDGQRISSTDTYDAYGRKMRMVDGQYVPPTPASEAMLAARQFRMDNKDNPVIGLLAGFAEGGVAAFNTLVNLEREAAYAFEGFVTGRQNVKKETGRKGGSTQGGWITGHQTIKPNPEFVTEIPVDVALASPVTGAIKASQKDNPKYFVSEISKGFTKAGGMVDQYGLYPTLGGVGFAFLPLGNPLKLAPLSISRGFQEVAPEVAKGLKGSEFFVISKLKGGTPKVIKFKSFDDMAKHEKSLVKKDYEDIRTTAAITTTKTLELGYGARRVPLTKDKKIVGTGRTVPIITKIDNRYGLGLGLNLIPESSLFKYWNPTGRSFPVESVKGSAGKIYQSEQALRKLQKEGHLLERDVEQIREAKGVTGALFDIQKFMKGKRDYLEIPTSYKSGLGEAGQTLFLSVPKKEADTILKFGLTGRKDLSATGSLVKKPTFVARSLDDLGDEDTVLKITLRKDIKILDTKKTDPFDRLTYTELRKKAKGFGAIEQKGVAPELELLGDRGVFSIKQLGTKDPEWSRIISKRREIGAKKLEVGKPEKIFYPELKGKTDEIFSDILKTPKEEQVLIKFMGEKYVVSKGSGVTKAWGSSTVPEKAIEINPTPRAKELVAKLNQEKILLKISDIDTTSAKKISRAEERMLANFRNVMTPDRGAVRQGTKIYVGTPDSIAFDIPKKAGWDTAYIGHSEKRIDSIMDGIKPQKDPKWQGVFAMISGQKTGSFAKRGAIKEKSMPAALKVDLAQENILFYHKLPKRVRQQLKPEKYEGTDPSTGEFWFRKYQNQVIEYAKSRGYSGVTKPYKRADPKSEMTEVIVWDEKAIKKMEKLKQRTVTLKNEEKLIDHLTEADEIPTPFEEMLDPARAYGKPYHLYDEKYKTPEPRKATMISAEEQSSYVMRDMLAITGKASEGGDRLAETGLKYLKEGRTLGRTEKGGGIGLSFRLKSFGRTPVTLERIADEAELFAQVYNRPDITKHAKVLRDFAKNTRQRYDEIDYDEVNKVMKGKDTATSAVRKSYSTIAREDSISAIRASRGSIKSLSARSVISSIGSRSASSKSPSASSKSVTSPSKSSLSGSSTSSLSRSTASPSISRSPSLSRSSISKGSTSSVSRLSRSSISRISKPPKIPPAIAFMLNTREQKRRKKRDKHKADYIGNVRVDNITGVRRRGETVYGRTRTSRLVDEDYRLTKKELRKKSLKSRKIGMGRPQISLI